MRSRIFQTVAASSRRKERSNMFRKTLMIALVLAAIVAPLATRTPEVDAVQSP